MKLKFMQLLAYFIIQIICINCFSYFKTSSRFSSVKKSLSKISLNGKWFVDEEGRVKLFRGINAVAKQAQWIPNYGHVNLSNKTQLEYLKKWGFNVIRLGFMWSGLYPQKNIVNQTYVDEMLNIINTLESYGIYVIIDLHQDMMSSKFSSYDGVPLWVLDELPPPKHSFPWPFFNNSTIGFGAYATEACSK
jgi:endoglycosylceramidase